MKHLTFVLAALLSPLPAAAQYQGWRNSGAIVIITTPEGADLPASAAKKITYLKEMKWSQDKLLWGANGIAALTFCDVPVSDAKKSGIDG